MTILTTLLASATILAICLYRLHTLSVKDRVHVRLVWVFLAAVSLFLPWSVLLVSTPAIVSPKIVVLDSSESRILMKVTTTPVRDCKVVSSNVEAKKGGLVTRLSSRYYRYTTLPYESETGILYIENKGFNTEDLNISLDHFCPFGVEVKTEIFNHERKPS